ncbi:exosporium glycoprotein BclB-related protein [Lysinibacillus sp. G4S2]|uniref:exosporium glycoprotein BclB-related protein n=1 Tax=Lysinibacillus sp. G4S2 TaxID=3055859 RepID=UPI0025A027A8|nr:exosporium glycoprotein BclB-related protein [Lysinibacillus sp. G4S2]MDM5250696.1 exosporium glycoprotein BclB-related protein [Lysinibacillus sp. G4S2]
MCINNSMCGCSSNNVCENFGPFLAVDAACITPSVNKGSIIPFSSGVTTVTLATIANGVIGVPSLIGFGSAVPGVTIVNNTLNLSNIITEAFVVPRAGNITAISASFSALATVAIPPATTPVPLAGTTTLRAQVYLAPAGSNVYTATSVFVNLAPAFSGLLIGNEIAFNSANVIPFPVAVGDKLLMVFSIAATTGVTIAQAITGTASAGITIE